MDVDGWPTGAWAYGFLRLKDPWMGGPNAGRLTTAILALKREFQYNGYTNFVYNGWYGDQFAKVVAQFQKDKGLTSGLTLGVIGPTVAGELFRKRAVSYEKQCNIPNKWLQRLYRLESASDPAAVGWVDFHDQGLVQISSTNHPEVTSEQAFDPGFALSFGANEICKNFEAFGDWEVAVVAHNIGTFGATLWLDAGKPATGGPDKYPTLFDRATFYLNLLEKQDV